MEPDAGCGTSAVGILAALRRALPEGRRSFQSTNLVQVPFNAAPLLVLSAVSPRAIDARLRGLCPLHIAIPPPTPEQRAVMLCRLAMEAGLVPPCAELAREISDSLHGFVPSDVHAVCEEARMLALMRRAKDKAADDAECQVEEALATRECLHGQPQDADVECAIVGLQRVSLADVGHRTSPKTMGSAKATQASCKPTDLAASVLPYASPSDEANTSSRALPAASSDGSPLLLLHAEEWRAAANMVHPAVLAGVATCRSALGGAKWQDVGGLKNVKRRLQQLVQWPLRAPALCASLGLGGPRGILLYGPPGTGEPTKCFVTLLQGISSLAYMTISSLIRA